MSEETRPKSMQPPTIPHRARGPQELPPPLISDKLPSSPQDSIYSNSSGGFFGSTDDERPLILASIAGGLILICIALLLFAFLSSNAGNSQKGAGRDQASTEVEGVLAGGESQTADGPSGDQLDPSGSTRDSDSEDPLAVASRERAESNSTGEESETKDEEAIVTKVPNRQQQYANPTRSGGVAGGRGGSSGIDLSSTKGINPFVGEGKKANSTIFVIDVSSSMLGDSRLPRVLNALHRAIDQLGEDQQFCVILFDTTYYVEPSVNGLIKATKRNKLLIQQWLQNAPGGGGTNPMAAMPQAIGLGPERIVLLSDGEFDPTNIATITALNKQRSRPSRIDCVGLIEDLLVLREIARENRGVYYQAW